MNLKQQWQIFLVAVLFFTRIPVARYAGYTDEKAARAAKYFPAVGWLVGMFAAGSVVLLQQFLPVLPALLLATALTILLTGAFHEDGFADMCDGFGGGWEKDQVLTIMKDSRLGTYGTLGLVLMLATKIAALAAMDPALLPCVLIAAHALSRMVSTSLIPALDYVQDDDAKKIRVLNFAITPADNAVMLVTGLAALWLLPLATWLAVLVALLVVRQAMAWYLRKRIGGYTGDCLGGVQQLAEVAVYIAVLVR